jgi:hypothetical protein
MIRKFVIGISLLGSLTVLAPYLQAEVIQIPVGQQSAELADTKRPQTGATEQQVVAQFGEPLNKKEARGNPPISSWEYADFVVYFENDHVIHSVLKHRPYVD